MIKKALLWTGILTLALMTTGCVFDVQNADILRPPKLSTELEAVKTALHSTYGSAIKLVNPLSGTHRAAIQFIDLDGDSEEEAVAFFRDQNEQNALMAAIFKKKSAEEGWQALPPIVGIGYDIDQVAFPDLNGDGIREIVVGWIGGSVLSKGLSVYQAHVVPTDPSSRLKRYEEGFREIYTNFHTVDLNMDGKEDLVTFLLSRPDNRAEARWYTLEAEGFVKQDTVVLAGDVHRYERLISGLVEEGRYGIVLDASLSGGASFSEVLIESQGRLVRRFATSGTSENSGTYRYDFRLTEDLDQDGWIEIPTLQKPTGYERVAKRDVPWITHWNHWDQEGNLLPVARTYDDRTLGFRVRIPELWDETVTVTRNDQGITFVEILENDLERVKIMEVLVMKRADAEQAAGQMKSLEYFELARTMEHVYFGKVYPRAGLYRSDFGMTEAQLKESFVLLNL